MPRKTATTAHKSAPAHKPAARGGAHKWSAEVTAHSHAMDHEEGVFTWSDPHKIALSLKRSAEASQARKSEPFQAAMSKLDFYINRGGEKLDAKQRKVLEAAKAELRKVFDR